MEKLIYIAIHVAMAVLFLFFCLFAVGMFYGSLEMFPAEEQQEKVRIAYGFIVFIILLLELALVKIRKKVKKKID